MTDIFINAQSPFLFPPPEFLSVPRKPKPGGFLVLHWKGNLFPLSSFSASPRQQHFLLCFYFTDIFNSSSASVLTISGLFLAQKRVAQERLVKQGCPRSRQSELLGMSQLQRFALQCLCGLNPTSDQHATRLLFFFYLKPAQIC